MICVFHAYLYRGNICSVISVIFHCVYRTLLLVVISEAIQWITSNVVDVTIDETLCVQATKALCINVKIVILWAAFHPNTL